MPVLPRQDADPPYTSPTTAPEAEHSLNPDAGIYGDHDGLTNAQVGGIVGAVIGFTALILFLIFCCLSRRRYYYRNHQKRRRGGGSYYSDSRSSTYTPSMVDVPPTAIPPKARVRRTVAGDVRGWETAEERPRERIPGGPRYPTYRALPIRNPRKVPQPRRHV